jgi:nucleoside-diphosphate-sugar epimerase
MNAVVSKQWENKRVLISGATGFIGSEVSKNLEQLGAYVTSITRHPPTGEALDWIQVSDSETFPSERIEAGDPEIIIHLATRFQAAHTPSDIRALIQSNVEFGTQLLESGKNLGARFVNVSSAWQHFEGKPYSPVSLYAATKQAFADIALYYSETGLDFRDLTIYDTYGPTDERNKLIRLLLLAAKTGTPIDMGEGNQLINLLFISDVVNAIVQIASDPIEQNEGTQSFVVRNDESISIKELVATIERVTGRPINAQWGARPERPREMLTDWQFGKALPNWKQGVRLEDGLAQCWKVLKSGA